MASTSRRSRRGAGDSSKDHSIPSPDLSRGERERKLDAGAQGRVFDLAWRLLVASSAFYFLCDNEADNDLWVHVQTGLRIAHAGAIPRADDLSYTATGAPWVDHEWLSQTLFASIFEGVGPGGLFLLKVGVAGLTAWMLWRAVARRAASEWARGVAMLLALAILSRGFAMRPQVVTYFGVACLFWWLSARDDAKEPRPFAPAILVLALGFVLWANSHGGFVYGLGVLGLCAAMPPWHGAAQRFAVLGAAVVAACITPFGPALFGYIGRELTFPHPVTEWQPVSLLAAEHRPLLVMLLLLAATLPFARGVWRPWRAALACATIAMAMRHQRHTPLVALVAAAPLAAQLDAAGAWIAQRYADGLSRTAIGALAASLIALALVQVGFLAERLARDGPRPVYEARDYPVGAVRFMRERGWTGNVALPLDWGSYVLWHAPAFKVSLDGRFATLYPPSVVEENFAFFRGPDADGAGVLLDRYPTTHVLAPRGVVTPAHRREGWRVLYRDDVAELLAREPATETVVGNAASGRLPFP